MSLVSKSAISAGDDSYVIQNTMISDPMPDEVIVKMKAAGICHTDYDSVSWGKPIVMGYEVAGVIYKIAIGDG